MMIGALREISPLVIEKVVKTALKTIKKGKNKDDKLSLINDSSSKF